MTGPERERFMVARFRDEQPEPEIVAEGRELDVVGNSRDRVDFMLARAAGLEFTDVERYED
jgi:hypothetical protein